MHPEPIPALHDNYIWMLRDDRGQALVVDPGEAAPVLSALARSQAKLTDILLTHHHPDHIGGALELAERFGARIVAPADERIGGAHLRVADGDIVELSAGGWQFQVLGVPGHTRSHVAYFGGGLLFAGDTLFSLGCGRLFEGTPGEMLGSLDRLSVLPADTRLCCGHEYTLANGAFALAVEPDNAALAARMRQAQVLRDAGAPTVPVTMATEKDTNPFLRIDTPGVKRWVGQQAGHAVGNRVARFATLRQAKDTFRA